MKHVGHDGKMEVCKNQLNNSNWWKFKFIVFKWNTTRGQKYVKIRVIVENIGEIACKYTLYILIIGPNHYFCLRFISSHTQMMTLIKNKIKSVFFNLIQMKQPQLMHVNSSVYIRSIIVSVNVTKYIYNAPCDDFQVLYLKK